MESFAKFDPHIIRTLYTAVVPRVVHYLLDGRIFGPGNGSPLPKRLPTLFLCLFLGLLLSDFQSTKAFSFHNRSLISSFQEWANAMVRRPSSVRPSVCKLLRKSLLLADKCHQTCTRWTPDQIASRMCSRSRSRQRSRDTRPFWILGMSYSVIDGLVKLNTVFYTIAPWQIFKLII